MSESTARAPPPIFTVLVLTMTAYRRLVALPGKSVLKLILTWPQFQIIYYRSWKYWKFYVSCFRLSWKYWKSQFPYLFGILEQLEISGSQSIGYPGNMRAGGAGVNTRNLPRSIFWNVETYMDCPIHIISRRLPVNGPYRPYNFWNVDPSFFCVVLMSSHQRRNHPGLHFMYNPLHLRKSTWAGIGWGRAGMVECLVGSTSP